MTAGLVLATLASDILFVGIGRLGGPGPFSVVGNVASGYATLLLISVATFSSVRLPQMQKVDTTVARVFKYRMYLLNGILAASGLVVIFFMFFDGQVNFLRDIALLGGIGPGLFLFAPLLTLLLFLIGTRHLKSHKRGHIRPPVAIIVPAFNEAEHIVDDQ